MDKSSPVSERDINESFRIANETFDSSVMSPSSPSTDRVNEMPTPPSSPSRPIIRDTRRFTWPTSTPVTPPSSSVGSSSNDRVTPPKRVAVPEASKLHAVSSSSSDASDEPSKSLRDLSVDTDAAVYYFGIPSPPRLCGTSRYNRPRQLWGMPAKFLFPIGDHDLALNWTTVALDISVFLASPGTDIQWTTIDLCRIGFDSDEPTPIVWIGVVPGTLSMADGNTAALRIKGTLGKYPDVEVELRESLYTLLGDSTKSSRYPLSFPTPPPPAFPEMSGLFRPFSPYLGVPIARSGTNTQGTGGFFIKRDDELYLVTARHIVLPVDVVDPNIPYEISSELDHASIVGPPDYRRQYMKRIRAETGNLRIKTGTVVSFPPPSPAQTADFDAWQKKTNEFRQLASLIQLENSVMEGLAIGQLAFSPQWKLVSSGGLDFFADIALIRVEPDLFADAVNLVSLRGYLGGDDLTTRREMGQGTSRPELLDNLEDIRHSSLSYDRGSELFQLPADRTIRIRDIIKVEELNAPTTYDFRRDKDGQPTDRYQHLKVMKNGMRTNITFGRGNNVMSLVRNSPWHIGTNSSDTATAWEWPIFADEPSLIFALQGDSGAAVVDGRGRIGGMIVGGSAENRDPTSQCFLVYATPAETIFEHLKLTFGDIRLA
ncbi:hypothetical protein P7C73_g1370, partial [Tremellales sp. Uapishka_1]